MSSYLDKHAELYDLFYTGKDYKSEAEFIHQCISRYSVNSKNILELACGTGNHVHQLKEYSYNILSTDYSKDMLAVAKKKVIADNVRFEWMDMTNFTIEKGDKFDVILCLFDSIGYVQSNENIIKVFQNIYDHLSDNGIFIFEFWNGGAFMKQYEPYRVRRIENEALKIVRISETEIDYVKQLGKVKYSIYLAEQNKPIEVIEELQVNRFFFIQEMKALLSQAGLIPMEFYNGYNFSSDIDLNSWHTVSVVKKQLK